MTQESSQRRYSRILIAVTVAIPLLIGVGLLAAVAGASDEPGQTGDVPKSEAPMNVNPKKTPVLEEDLGNSATDMGDDPSTYTPEERRAAQQFAREAEMRTETDATFIACFTRGGLIAEIVEKRPADPNKPPMSKSERDRYCSSAFPGTRGSRQ